MPRKKSEITATENNQLSVFDYSSLDANTAKLAKESAIEIKAREKAIWENIIEIGNRLIEVKNALPRGKFGQWIDDEFQWSDDTAQKYMKISQELGQYTENSRFFPKGKDALYRLASALGKADEETKEEILTAVEQETEQQGKPLTEKEIKKLIDDAKKANKKALGELKNYLRGLDDLKELFLDELAKKYDLDLDSVKSTIQEIKTEKDNQRLKQRQEQLEAETRSLKLAKQKSDSDLKESQNKLTDIEKREKQLKDDQKSFLLKVDEEAKKKLEIEAKQLRDKKKEYERLIEKQKQINDQLNAKQKQFDSATNWLKRIEGFNASLNTKVVNIVSTVKDINAIPNFEELDKEQREAIFPYFSSVMNEFEKNSEAWGKAINQIYFALNKADKEVVNLINQPIDVEVSE